MTCVVQGVRVFPYVGTGRLPASIVARKQSREPWVLLIEEGEASCDLQISADDVLSRIHYRRIDQANHNLLISVGEWSFLLPPCYRTAVLTYHSVP